MYVVVVKEAITKVPPVLQITMVILGNNFPHINSVH